MSTTEKTYKVKAGEFVFSFTEKEILAVDMIKKSPGEYNLIHQYHSVNAKLTITDPAAKKASVEVEGERFDTDIKDELDQMLEVMGFGRTATKYIREIKAPMPGLVLDISVTEGQEIKEGERVLVLEAMKMENSIMIYADATIKKILVKPGQAVEKGHVLVELA